MNNNIKKDKYINFYKSPFNLQNFISIKSYSLDYNNQFCVFNSIKNNTPLLICKYEHINLLCYNLITFELIKFIKNLHLFFIYCIKHFINKNNDIIITSSEDNKIKIINVSKDWEIIKIINNVGDNQVYNIFSILLLSDNGNDYIISCNENDSYLKLYNFNDSKFIKNIFNNNLGVRFIDNYFDKEKKLNFIIISLFNSNQIKVYNFTDLIEYFCYNNITSRNYIITEINGNVNFIIPKLWSNEIFIYDFHQGNLIYKIQLNNNIKLNCLLLWNENYLFSGAEDKNIYIIDLINKKEIKCYKSHNKKVYTLMKIKVQNYEYLISQGWSDDGIKIWK